LSICNSNSIQCTESTVAEFFFFGIRISVAAFFFVACSRFPRHGVSGPAFRHPCHDARVCSGAAGDFIFLCIALLQSIDSVSSVHGGAHLHSVAYLLANLLHPFCVPSCCCNTTHLLPCSSSGARSPVATPPRLIATPMADGAEQAQWRKRRRHLSRAMIRADCAVARDGHENTALLPRRLSGLSLLGLLLCVPR
jgi:hypothetical protein